jgi:hypothetical protein
VNFLGFVSPACTVVPVSDLELCCNDLLRIIKYEEICYSYRLCIFIVLQPINGSPAEIINNSFLKTAKYSLVTSFPAESGNVFVIKLNLNDLVKCFNTRSAKAVNLTGADF